MSILDDMVVSKWTAAWWFSVADVSNASLCLLQYHGPLRIRGAGDREIRPRVLQRCLALHHVRRASMRRPHPQALHRHLPRERNRWAGAGGGPLRQTHLPLPLARDYDQMDAGEDQMSLKTQRSQRRRMPLLAGRQRQTRRQRFDCQYLQVKPLHQRAQKLPRLMGL